MKFLLDFAPVVLFVIGFVVSKDIVFATLILLVATFFQFVITWLIYRKVEKLALFSLIIVGVFGGLTLWLNNPAFIKWKPSIFYWVMALALLANLYLAKKIFLQKIFGTKIELPTIKWRNVTLVWSVFFIFLGILNLYVAFNFDDQVWVYFKLFGLLALTLLLLVLQTFYFYKHAVIK